MHALVLALASVSSATTIPPVQDSPWVVGKPAPHVHLPDLRSGAAVDLADLRGKKVLLAEFASW